MLCPYCGSQNPDDAPLCSSCNAVLAESAQTPAPAAAGYAPTPYPAGSFTGAGAPPAAAPNEAKPPKKGGKGKWIALIVAGSVVLLGAIIALVAFVTCTAINASKINLDTLVTEDPEKVAKYIEDLEIVKLYGDAYYTPSNMKETASKANKAFDEGSRNAIGKIRDDIEELSPWALAFFEQEKAADDDGYRKLKNLKLANIQDKGNPSEVIYRTYRVLEDPTPEDLYKIAQEVAEIDELTIGSNPTQQAEEDYSQNIYFAGYGEGPNSLIYVRMNKLDDVYEISVIVFNADELKGKGVRFLDNAKRDFNDDFKNEDKFPKKD